MKRIAVFFDEPGYGGYPFDEEDYVIAYHELAKLIEERGAECYIVRDQRTYVGGQDFSGGWKYADGKFQQVDGTVKSDRIFNKGYFVADPGADVINVPELDKLCIDKYESYKAFKKFCPRTEIAHSAEELHAACSAMRTQLVVFKPLDKEGGEGVMICPPDEGIAQVREFPYLVQEFIDTSGGIPHVMKGYHDLRIVCVNGKITHSYYRTPPTGSLLANVARGGSMQFFQQGQIPDGAIAIFKEIESVMSKRFPKRVYSVDTGCDIDGTWKIIEMNSKPGLVSQGTDPSVRVFHESIADLLFSD